MVTSRARCSDACGGADPAEGDDKALVGLHENWRGHAGVSLIHCVLCGGGRLARAHTGYRAAAGRGWPSERLSLSIGRAWRTPERTRCGCSQPIAGYGHSDGFLLSGRAGSLLWPPALGVRARSCPTWLHRHSLPDSQARLWNAAQRPAVSFPFGIPVCGSST